ncbi:hypothetical protein BD770DRAFT_226528 [Pilaira anomala]|nr:hypothetical protein BD770DRAFT_226528 [Pilaira anomala]
MEGKHHSSAMDKVASQNYRFYALIRKEYTSSDCTTESLLVCDQTPAKIRFIEGSMDVPVKHIQNFVQHSIDVFPKCLNKEPL